MEKLAKYYLSSEAFVLGAIFVSGLFDPSFWFYGVAFGGIIITFCGLIISLVWYMRSVDLNKSALLPTASFISNIVILCLMSLFVYSVLSAGIHFTI